ncbi:MAG: DUF3006 domain-containing protein [Myxococcales bacterium]|nr:DUF3006 domain-containing protein [Myxococcales bacterium]
MTRRAHRDLPFVDRIEGNVAIVLIDGQERQLPTSSLPAGAREGCVLTADLTAFDENATRAARERVAALRTRAGNADDGSDFSL